MSGNYQDWVQFTESALFQQRCKFEQTAETWMTECKELMHAEKNQWRQEMISEEQQIARLAPDLYANERGHLENNMWQSCENYIASRNVA